MAKATTNRWMFLNPKCGDHSRIPEIEQEIELERYRARRKHRELASWHEAYAVILEELEEFWEGVKADDPDPSELCEVAASCINAINELVPGMWAAIESHSGSEEPGE